MQFTDPFDADTSKFKKLIDRDEYPDAVEYEEINDNTSDDQSSSKSKLLDDSTVKGLPPQVFKLAKAKEAEAAKVRGQKEAVKNMFNQLFSDLNQKYGLNVHFDVDSLSNSVNYIIEPRNKKAMEYYLSEAYGRYRVILYQQYLQAIALLSNQILDPAYILSDSMTYDQKLDTLERLYQFMVSMNDIYKEVNIPDTEMKLEKISTDSQKTYDLNDPKIREYMDNIFNKVISKDSNNELKSSTNS